MADLEEYEAIVGDGETKGEQQPKRKDDDKQYRRRSDEVERSRDKDKDKTSRRRSRSRDKDRPRRNRDRDNDYRSSSKRSRSRDRDRSRRDRDKPDPLDRDRDRHGFRGRDRDRRPPPMRRDVTPPEVRAQRERERELRELERATRTVFAFNLNIKADERDIYDFFSKAGQVTDIRLITDRHTKRSKGLAYVEFSKQEEVFIALALTGQLMLGQPVMVKPAEAEKNLAWEAQQAAKQSTAAEAELAALGLVPTMLQAPAPVVQPLKLQVTGFKKGLTEKEIQQIFEPFGPIDSVMVVRDGAGQPIDIAYVVFRSSVDGENAKAHWHGKVLLDHKLNVVVAPLKGADVAAADPNAGIGDLDDDDYKLNPQARAALMGRLAASAGMGGPPSAGAVNPLLAAAMPAAASGMVPGILPGGLIAPVVPGAMAAAAAAAVPGLIPAAVPGAGAANGGLDLSLQQGRLGPPSPIPTQCLLLKNMFDEKQKADAGWADEILDDVREECSKLGQVQHIYLDKDSQGFVYIKFGTAEAAAAAFKMLHGRFYNGHQIQAAYQFVQTYNQHFSL